MVAQALLSAGPGPGPGLAQLLALDAFADAAVHVASAAAAVSWVQEATQRRFTAAAFQGLAKGGSGGSCPAGFGVGQDYRIYKVPPPMQCSARPSPPAAYARPAACCAPTRTAGGSSAPPAAAGRCRRPDLPAAAAACRSTRSS
jgi:hypothetical protein